MCLPFPQHCTNHVVARAFTHSLFFLVSTCASIQSNEKTGGRKRGGSGGVDEQQDNQAKEKKGKGKEEEKRQPKPSRSLSLSLVPFTPPGAFYNCRPPHTMQYHLNKKEKTNSLLLFPTFAHMHTHIIKN